MTKKPDEPLIKSMDSYPETKFITTGVPALDKICGGFPRSRITEIYGKKSVGKTTLVMLMLAAISKDHKVLFIDAENALNVSRLAELGAELKNIDFSTEYVLDDVGELILANMAKYDCIILDSIAGTIGRTEQTSDVGEYNVGTKGRVMNSLFSRRVPGPLAKTNCALILINQLRDSFNLYGEKTYTPGGKAIEYAASLRIELNTLAADRIIENGQQVGHNVTAKITKSKISAPYQTARFKILY
jgi:recombination protein RecA